MEIVFQCETNTYGKMKNFGTDFASLLQCDGNGVIIGCDHVAKEGNRMLKRILFFILFVIIIVSLNWFKVVLAQDLSKLSDEEKEQLIKQYQLQADNDSLDNSYKTPPIYDQEDKTTKTEKKSLIPDSLKQKYQSLIDLEQDSTLQKKVELIPFEDLKPFGLEIFDDPRDLEPPVEIAAASDYILGPGDNVIIYLWGRVDKQLNLTLDREGKIFIQQVGEIVAWGLTVEKFTELAKERLSSAYSDFKITVSLGKIRSIRIFISGEVKYPGAYTVSSLSSVYNALYFASGPNNLGSMRQIKLMRNGKKRATVDLYDFLLKGDNTNDLRLESGDVIFVPVAGSRVAIRGEINRPAIYELLGNETGNDLLALAGNPTPTAYLDRVMLERISNQKEWVVLDLNLNPLSSKPVDKLVLQDGDRITVNGIFDFEKSKVGIFGQVQHPGYYERNDSTKISDLLLQSHLQTYDVYLERADLFRRYEDWSTEVIAINLREIIDGNPEADLLLMDLDSIHIHSIEEISWDKWVFIEGAIKEPGQYRLYNNMTVADLIFLAGSYNREASRHEAELARLDSSGEVSLMYISLASDSVKKIILEEDDHLYVRHIPEWQFNPVVAIEGEVRYPGQYMLSSRDETLYQIIKRTGGFTRTAFPTGLVLERESIGENMQRIHIRGLIEKTQPLVEDSVGNLVRSNVFEFDLKSVNRIIIDMEKLLDSEGKQGDIILEPGDQVYVPSIPSGVTVMGAVGANGTIKFNQGLKVKDYIKRAGNFTRRSDKNETKLIRANGEIISGKKSLGQKVLIGDVIFVPSKIERERNFLKAFTEVLSATTGILTTIYIVSKL